jgi:DNA-binding MurR/RpiR family transcriptional regulator
MTTTVNPTAPAAVTDGPVRAAIRAALGSLIASEARVAQLILDAPDVMHRSVTEVAVAADVSASTVVRACQRLGYSGFQQLKLALAGDGMPAIRRLQGDVADGDAPGDVLAKVLAGGEEALRSVERTIDVAAFADAARWISGARRVLVCGVGTSAPLAHDVAYRLMSIGIDAESPADTHVQHVRAALLGADDACLVVSHTGATTETLAAASAARAAGAKTIAVTSFVRSPLTEIVDAPLVASSRELSYRIEAMASRIAHLCVLDALVVAVALTDVRRTSDAQSATAGVLAEHRY